MYSAKKVAGQKLYHLARRGIEIKRKAHPVFMQIILEKYAYPFLNLNVTCSSGTYIRSLAYDLGERLGCFAHLNGLQRTRLGPFHIEEAVSQEKLMEANCDILPFLKKELPCSSSTI